MTGCASTCHAVSGTEGQRLRAAACPSRQKVTESSLESEPRCRSAVVERTEERGWPLVGKRHELLMGHL